MYQKPELTIYQHKKENVAAHGLVTHSRSAHFPQRSKIIVSPVEDVVRCKDDRIDSKLRKKLAEVFLHLEIYNDDLQRYEDYSIQPNFNKNIENNLEEAAKQSKNQLLSLCKETLELARSLGKMKP